MFVAPPPVHMLESSPQWDDFRGLSDLDEVMGLDSPYGISPLISRERREMKFLSTTQRYKEVVIFEPGGGPSLRSRPCWPQISDFQPQNGEK